MTKLIVALDTKSPEQARSWAEQTGPHADAVKLGLEFTYACGLDSVQKVSAGIPLFLDLKLHDIPNTVGSAIQSLSRINPSLLTIHAAGGPAMIEAARNALESSYPAHQRPTLLAVTVLTSMDENDLRATGILAPACEQVVRLGSMAIGAGADGLVCSAHEITALRDKLGAGPVLVVPGIRPAISTGAGSGDDQRRVMTPGEAARAGADWIVVGRPITRADDPAAAAKSIAEELGAEKPTR